MDLKRDKTVPLAQYLGDRVMPGRRKGPKQSILSLRLQCQSEDCRREHLLIVSASFRGLPGQAKTQTILNIIANLLLEHKTVLVVSNNNSAVENVAKLASEDLGFIVAKLGSKENKQALSTTGAGIRRWGMEVRCQSCKTASTSRTRSLSQGFDSQMRQARLKAEYDQLLKEAKYNEMLQQPSPIKMAG